VDAQRRRGGIEALVRHSPSGTPSEGRRPTRARSCCWRPGSSNSASVVTRGFGNPSGLFSCVVERFIQLRPYVGIHFEELRQRGFEAFAGKLFCRVSAQVAAAGEWGAHAFDGHGSGPACRGFICCALGATGVYDDLPQHSKPCEDTACLSPAPTNLSWLDRIVRWTVLGRGRRGGFGEESKTQCHRHHGG